MRPRLAVLASLAIVGVNVAPAAADPHAEAVVLFDQGIKDMKAGRLDTACPALQASLDLVKDSGTKGALARCHGLAGRVATAWFLWRALADTAPTAALRTDAAAQAARLEPRLPRYTIKLAGPTPGLVVEIDGKPVSADVAVPVPIDPGPVRVLARGSATEHWTHEYVALEGRTIAIAIPALAALPEPRPGNDIVAPAEGTPRRRRVAALTLGAAAVGVAAVGSVLGLRARSQYADARKICGGVIDECVPEQVPASQALVDQARTSAVVSSISFGVAGATAVAAAIVWFTAPSSGHVVAAPTVSGGTVGVALSGAF